MESSKIKNGVWTFKGKMGDCVLDIVNMPEISFTIEPVKPEGLTETWCGIKNSFCQAYDVYEMPYPKDLELYE
tara:strand:+ start:3265 stop:3483 length:219 start_codon:yes stop_codon:yes gene_type:complete